MIVRVLGSAAGGGVPQWNCACANCTAARSGTQPKRSQSTIAVSPDGHRWILINCSPDIAFQIESFAALQPRAPRETPIAGMLFTDANIDHMGGLAVLRQSGPHRFLIRSSAVTRAIAARQPAFSPLMQAPHVWIEAPFETPLAAVDETDAVGSEMRVTVFPVCGTTPGYDGRRTVEGATVAYEIEHRGTTVLFAPVFGAMDARLLRAIERASAAFLDGTFYRDDEMAESGVTGKGSRKLGHLPVGEPDGTLALLGTNARQTIFTHINNTNPMLEPQSAAARQVREAGARIAFDGFELKLD